MGDGSVKAVAAAVGGGGSTAFLENPLTDQRRQGQRGTVRCQHHAGRQNGLSRQSMDYFHSKPSQSDYQQLLQSDR